MDMNQKQRAALDRWITGEDLEDDAVPPGGPTKPQDEPEPPPLPAGYTRPQCAPLDLVAVRLRLQEALATQQGGTAALNLDRWATREEAWADAVGCVLEANTLSGVMADMTGRMRHITEARRDAEKALQREIA